MKYTFNLHYYIFFLSQQPIFSFVLNVRTMHGGAVHQVTAKQVTPKLVPPKLVTKGLVKAE